MSCQIYLGLTGPELVVRNFQKAVNLSGAVVCELGTKIRSSTPRKWEWRTARKAIDGAYGEDAIVPFLREYEILLEELNRHRHEAEIRVTIIFKSDEDQPSRGLYLSRETVELLSQFGASLEIDSVTSMSQAKAN